MHRAILFATFLAAVFAQPPAPVTPAPVTPVDPNINPPSGPGQPGCEGIPPVGPLDPTQLGTVLPQLNQTLCACRNWDLGDLVDPNFLPGPYPVPGQQVYIQDEQNFCIQLPNLDHPFIKERFTSQGKKPTIVQGEGYVQSFCMGSHLPPGSKPLPAGGITAAHVIKNTTNVAGQNYWQITGRMDCNALGIDCVGSAPGAYDDGGQYDDVPFRKCGKEPYSGTDPAKHPGYKAYVEQAGNGIFCMRICDGEKQESDPCNVKNDTAGCFATMGMIDADGFSFLDAATGEKRGSIPTTTTAVTSTAAPTTAAPSPSVSPAGTNAAAGLQGWAALVVSGFAAVFAGAFLAL